MKRIETNTMISIKKTIEKYPETSANLLREGDLLEGDIATFAYLSGISEIFIKQNLQQIRNWI